MSQTISNTNNLSNTFSPPNESTTSQNFQSYQDAQYYNQRGAKKGPTSPVLNYNTSVPIGPALTRVTPHSSSSSVCVGAVSHLGANTNITFPSTATDTHTHTHAATSVWNATTSNLPHAATCTAVVKSPYGGDTVMFIAGDRRISAIYLRNLVTQTTRAGHYCPTKLGDKNKSTSNNKNGENDSSFSQYQRWEDIFSSSVATVVTLKNSDDSEKNIFEDNNYNFYNTGRSGCGSGGSSITCISVVPLPGNRTGEMLGLVGLTDATIVPFICRPPCAYTKDGDKISGATHRLITPAVYLLPHLSLSRCSSYNISPTEAVLSVVIGLDPTNRVEFIAAATSNSVSIFACSSISQLFHDYSSQGVGSDLVDVSGTADDDIINDYCVNNPNKTDQVFIYKGFQLYSDASVVKICAVQHTSDCGGAGKGMMISNGLNSGNPYTSVDPPVVSASVVVAVFLADSTVRFIGRLFLDSSLDHQGRTPIPSYRLLHQNKPIVSLENTMLNQMGGFNSSGKYRHNDDTQTKISEEAGIITSVPIHHIPTSIQEPEYCYAALMEKVDVGNIIYNTEAAIGGSASYTSTSGAECRPSYSLSLSPLTVCTPVGHFTQQSSAGIRTGANNSISGGVFPSGASVGFGAAFGDTHGNGVFSGGTTETSGAPAWRGKLEATLPSGLNSIIVVNDAEVVYNAYSGDLDIISAGFELIPASSPEQFVMPLVGVVYGALKLKQGVTSSSHSSTSLVSAIIPSDSNNNTGAVDSTVLLGKCLRANRLGHLQPDRRGISIVRVIGGSTGSQFSGVGPACPGSSAGASSSPFSQASLVAAGHELFVCHVSCVSNAFQPASVVQSQAHSQRPSVDKSMRSQYTGIATGPTLTRFGTIPISSGVSAVGNTSTVGATTSSYFKLLHSFGGPIQDIQVIGMSYCDGGESNIPVNLRGKPSDSLITTVRVLVVVGRKAHVYTFVL